MLFLSVFLLVAVQSLDGAKVNKDKETDFGIIRFPIDDDSASNVRKPAKLQEPLGNRYGDSDVPESCKDQLYCTIKPANYPEKKFNDMFKGYKIPHMPVAQERVLENRFNYDGFKTGCEVETIFEPLYRVRPKRDVNSWVNVVQSLQNGYVQNIRIETCKSTGSCFEPLQTYTPQFDTACVQMNTVWQILVENADKNDTETIDVELPTCCSCMYKEVQVLSRFGGTSPANNTKA